MTFTHGYNGANQVTSVADNLGGTETYQYDTEGRLTQEQSKLVLIVAPPGPTTRANLESIRTEYRHTFNQQSVGLTLAQVCADF